MTNNTINNITNIINHINNIDIISTTTISTINNTTNNFLGEMIRACSGGLRRSAETTSRAGIIIRFIIITITIVITIMIIIIIIIIDSPAAITFVIHFLMIRETRKSGRAELAPS